VLIVLPSILSAIGIGLVVTGVLVHHEILRGIFLSIGLLLLWLDIFLTMAVMRRVLRSVDGRLRRIEASLDEVQASRS
jgi:hypothetical protein